MSSTAPVNFKTNPELKKFVLKDAQPTGRKLGVGSFGSVVEITVGGTYYAGKKLHDNLLDSYNQGHSTLLDRFISECKIMSELRHPNIVQFMGLCFFPESNYPLLVMEQLDTSLDDLLEKRKKNFSLAPKLHILHDVAAGLFHLHEQCTPPIVHRDLTTRNVLVNNASMQAKIADLGNALMIDPAKFSSTLSQMPGTMLYMPPEATRLKPKYDSSLDMFSFGQLSLYTIIQEFPADLLPATYEDPETDELKARSEITRRGQYFDMLHDKLSEEHVICTMIKKCLSNKPSARPKASDVMDQLEDLIGDEDDPYEVFADVCKLDLLELLNRKDDSTRDLVTSTEIQSRMDQIKNGAPGVLEIYRTGVGILKRSVWKMYFFQMTPTHVKYFKSSARNYQKVIDEFRLADINSVRYTTPITNEDPSKFYFEIAESDTAVGKSWLLRTHTEEERTSWMSAIKPSSTRRYTADKSPRQRDSQIVPPSEACYDEIDTLRAPPSKFQPNEAYNVLEETRRPKSPRTNASRLPPGGNPPLPPTIPKPSPSMLIKDRSQVDPANRPPPLPRPMPQKHQQINVSQKTDRVESLEPSKEKQTVSNTYIDINEINAAAFLQDDDESLYETLPEDEIFSVSQSVPHVPPNHPSLKKMPQTYLIPTEGKHEPFTEELYEDVMSRLPQETEKFEPELYEDIMSPLPQETEDTYEDINDHQNGGNSEKSAKDIPNVPDSPLKLEQMMKLDPNQLQMMMLIQMQMMMQKMNPLLSSEGATKSPPPPSPKPPGHSPGKNRPPPPLPAETNVHDEPPVECIYDEDVSTKIKRELRKNVYVNIWDDMKASPPPVPPKPKLKPALPPKPNLGKLQTAETAQRPTTASGVEGEPPTNSRNVQKAHKREPSGADLTQKRTKSFLRRRGGNLQQNFTDMKMMLGNLLVQNEKLSSDNMLLDEDDEEESYIARPNWAKAKSLPSYSRGQPKEEDSLLALQKQALFIPRSSIQNLQPIGQGQFGKVYKAKLHKGSGSSVEVAVKTIKKFKSEKETDDFLREMTVMSQMIHPNVVRLHGLIQQASPWMILELLPHGDLKKFLTNNKRPIEKLIKYMLDVAVGMHYIAEKGLIHRDLAARNVMVGENEICKVADFGLLRELPDGEAIYIQSSQTLVPIRWLAPESIEKRHFSTASDVWSYGILLWEMFQPTKLPYEEYEDNMQCAISVIHGHRLMVPEPYPTTVERIMKNCWHKIPDKRPSFLLISSLLTNVTFGQY